MHNRGGELPFDAALKGGDRAVGHAGMTALNSPTYLGGQREHVRCRVFTLKVKKRSREATEYSDGPFDQL